jgi:D-arabinose 1-dehydrogenase-like Zn-dependent alcohol dehydrogenase
VIPIDRINEAFDDIVAGTVRYRYVIDTASSESEVTID